MHIIHNKETTSLVRNLVTMGFVLLITYVSDTWVECVWWYSSTEKNLLFFGHYFSYVVCWLLISILWHLFAYPCFIAYEIRTFSLVLKFLISGSRNSSNCSAFLCRGLPVGVWSFRCFFDAVIHTVHCSRLVVCWSPLHSVDWGDVLNRIFRNCDKRSRLHSERLLNRWARFGIPGTLNGSINFCVLFPIILDD